MYKSNIVAETSDETNSHYLSLTLSLSLLDI